MYAVWLMLDTDQHNELAKLISQLGQEHDGPLFLPHITLLSSLDGNEDDLILKTSRLSEKMKAFSVHSEGIQTDDSYYRSLYLKIALTNTLIEYRKNAEIQFNQKPADDFMPHLSLLYGNQPIAIKNLIKDKLASSVRKKLLIHHVDLISAFGPPEEWKTILSKRLY